MSAVSSATFNNQGKPSSQNSGDTITVNGRTFRVRLKKDGEYVALSKAAQKQINTHAQLLLKPTLKKNKEINYVFCDFKSKNKNKILTKTPTQKKVQEFSSKSFTNDLNKQKFNTALKNLRDIYTGYKKGKGKEKTTKGSQKHVTSKKNKSRAASGSESDARSTATTEIEDNNLSVPTRRNDYGSPRRDQDYLDNDQLSSGAENNSPRIYSPRQSAHGSSSSSPASTSSASSGRTHKRPDKRGIPQGKTYGMGK